LLQLLYGNISFYPEVRLIDLSLPAALLDALPGPAGGVAGLRQACGVDDRSLLMKVLKPRGAPPAQLADQAAAFVRGGGDLIKDDQNLVDHDLSAFTQRVRQCAQAVEAAVQRRGRGSVYFPHVAGSGSHLEAQLEQVCALGLKGVVLCPWIMGLETAAEAARRFGLMWLAHPAAAGCWTESPRSGVAAAVLLGQLTRAAGADISAFPGQGGRVSLANDSDQRAICQALLKPWGELKATLPCSGGGKRPQDAVELSLQMGADSAVMVGSALMMDERGIECATAETVAALQHPLEYRPQ
jgi:ribulose-bisphosphate carboxylase large chain